MPNEQHLNSPVEKAPVARVDPITEDFHGVQISDSYRWLENTESPETQRFVAAQNAHTRAVLEQAAGRDELRRRIEKLLTIGRVASPRIGGEQYFYERRDG